MKRTIRFTVDTARGYPGKWVAHMFSAQKVDGMPFGIYGVTDTYLGCFNSKDAALAAVATKKTKLLKAA